MTPEELDRRANDCAMEASRTRKPRDTNADIAIEAARLALSNWQPTPKPNPRVLAMREYLKTDPHASKEWCQGVDEGVFDGCNNAQTFLAGYAAAVKEGRKLEEALRLIAARLSVNAQTTEDICATLTTYLTAIGDETP